MWFIISIFGFIGGIATDKSNAKVSDFSFMIGCGAGTVFMIERMIIRNDEGIMFYIFAILALALVILTISYFVSFMKKL